MLAAAAPAFAHDGHGEIDFHWHGGDLLTVLAMAVAVGVWLWRRNER